MSSTDLEAELDKVDNNEEIVDDRVHVVTTRGVGTLGIVSPRPQKDSIENNDAHDNSAEPLGADHSIPYHSMHTRTSVFRRLHTTTALGMLLRVLTVLFGTLPLHQFPIYFAVFCTS